MGCAVGDRRYVSTVRPTMCFGGKKLTGRKKKLDQLENQHCDLNRMTLQDSHAQHAASSRVRTWNDSKR